MDKATAERIRASFDRALADWQVKRERERWDGFAARGFTGSSQAPNGLLVQAEGGQHFRVPLLKRGDHYLYGERETWEEIEVIVTPKAPAKATASITNKATVRGAAPEKSEAAKPATDVFRVNPDEYDEQRKARVLAQAARNRSADLTPDQAREKLRQIGRGTLSVSSSELRRIDSIASQGRKASASAFDLATTEDKAEAAKDELDLEQLRKRWYSEGKPRGISWDEFRKGRR